MPGTGTAHGAAAAERQGGRRLEQQEVPLLEFAAATGSVASCAVSRAADFARRLSSDGASGLLVEVDPPDRDHTLIGVYEESADSHVIVTVPHKGPAPITVTKAALKAPLRPATMKRPSDGAPTASHTSATHGLVPARQVGAVPLATVRGKRVLEKQVRPAASATALPRGRQPPALPGPLLPRGGLKGGGSASRRSSARQAVAPARSIAR